MTSVAARVLLVNHTAAISGGELSLLDLVAHLPAAYAPVLAAPEGPLARRTRSLGVPVRGVVGTAGSLKLHPVRTPVALAELVRTGAQVARLARELRADLVHANTLRAALACLLARRLTGLPLVVHGHDALGDDPASRAIGRLVLDGADAVLANSAYTATSFARLARGAPIVVVDNPVDLARFDPDRVDRAAARRDLGLAPDAEVLAVVGQVTPWKGQDTAIAALAALRERRPRAVLLVAGAPVFVSAATRFDNEAYQRGLHEQAARLGLADRVRFLGAVDDVPAVLAASDVALVPSWEEPFGRVVIEAMAMGVPVLATDRGGPREVLAGGGGRLLDPHHPAAWAAAVDELLAAGPDERARIGAQGRRAAVARYGLERFVARVTDAYAQVLGGARRRPPRE